MFEFRALEVYKKAKQFHFSIQRIIQEVPLHRSVADQLFRASLSVPINIAEGSGRFSKADRRNFFVIARSSIFESVSILDILKDGNQISEQSYQEMESMADELSRILFTIVRNLEKSLPERKTEPERSFEL